MWLPSLLRTIIINDTYLKDDKLILPACFIEFHEKSAMMIGRHVSVLCLLACGLWPQASRAEDKNAGKKEIVDSFAKDLRPIFAKYCVSCHSGSKPKAPEATPGPPKELKDLPK